MRATRNPMRALLTVLIAAMLPAGVVYADQYTREVFDQLEQQANAAGLQNFSTNYYVIEKLTDDESSFWNFNFNSGTNYVISGACDSDCTDLDLIVRDEYGNEVVRDVLTDRYPVVRFTPRRSGTYEIEVKMYQCNAVYCLTGMAIYEQ